MPPQRIRLFIKPYCGWCREAIAWLDSHGFKYETLDVTSNRAAAQEHHDLTGQGKAPSIDIDGEILADFDTGELETFLRKIGVEY